MKINRIRVFLLPFLLFTMASVKSDEQLPPSWDKETQAVYELLVAQMKNSGADYVGSVDMLVKFAKEQKNERLIAKAFRALLQTERYADAVDIAALWKENSKNDINKFYVLALALNKETEKALSEIDKVIPKNNDTQREKILYQYVQALNSSWYQDGIPKALAKLHEKYPDDGIVSESYVNSQRWQNNIDAAVSAINSFLFKDPKNLALLQEKSDAYRYALRLTEAEMVWKNILKDYPDEANFRFSYAQFLFDKYDYKRAHKQLEMIEKGNITFAIMQLKMKILIELGEYSKSDLVFDWSVLTKFESAAAHYRIGGGLLDKKEYDLALLSLQKVSEESDFALPAALKIGVIKYRNDVASGDEWFEKIEKDYKLEKDIVLQESARALENAGKVDLALERLKEFIVANPKNENVRYSRALTAADIGMDKLATEDLKLLHANTPNNDDVQNALGFTLLGEPEELKYADSLIKKSLFINPASPPVIDSMGWSLHLQKKHASSLPFFRYAYSHFKDGEVIGHYIMALLGNKEIDFARKLYKLEIQNEHNKDKILKITKSAAEELK